MKRFFWIGIFLTQTLWAYETPSSVSQKYRYLYEAKLQALPDGSVQFHQGRLFRKQGILILSLKGDEFEMAFQHGKLLREEIATGALPETAKLLENAVRNSLPEIPFVTSAVVDYFYSNYTYKILEHGIKSKGGDRDKSLLPAYGLSEGSGISLDTVIRGLVGPESLQVVLGERMKGKSYLPKGGQTSSCTDFVVRGQGTPSGEMIIGRNTDYPLNEYYDKYPTLIYFQPNEGQKFLSVTSAGLHNAGVIGFNESGLFLGVHTIPTTNVSAEGNPIFLVGHEVLQMARTFDEAVALFEKFKPAAGWTYTLASVHENRVASVELSNKKISVLEASGDWHVQTNHYRTAAMLKHNLDLNASIHEDTRARELRAGQLIQSNFGSFSAEDAVSTLADKWDPIHEKVSGMGNVVAVHTTVSSAVFDPMRGRLFMAAGKAPVSLTPFVEFPLPQSFDESSFSSLTPEIIEKSDYHKNFPLISQAEQRYIKAKNAFEINNDPKTSAKLFEDCVGLDPQNSAYSFIHGIMSLKAGLFEKAEQSFEETTRKANLHYRLASMYYLGRIWASRGKAQEAKEIFIQVLKEADPVVEKTLIPAVKKALKQVKFMKYVSLSPSQLVVFLPEGDMIEY